jgi:hypothetical protein
MPREDGGLSPIKIFTKQVVHDHSSLTNAHVWGCPVYVLDPKLQDGKKLPKWDPHACPGMYLGMSVHHLAASILRILNLRTGHISPQFHMVYDHKFTTINNPEGAGLVDPTRFDANHWERIFETGHELYLDPYENELPDLDDSWLTPFEQSLRLQRRTAQNNNRNRIPQPEPDVRLEGGGRATGNATDPLLRVDELDGARGRRRTLGNDRTLGNNLQHDRSAVRANEQPNRRVTFDFDLNGNERPQRVAHNQDARPTRVAQNDENRVAEPNETFIDNEERDDEPPFRMEDDELSIIDDDGFEEPRNDEVEPMVPDPRNDSTTLNGGLRRSRCTIRQPR